MKRIALIGLVLFVRVIALWSFENAPLSDALSFIQENIGTNRRLIALPFVAPEGIVTPVTRALSSELRARISESGAYEIVEPEGYERVIAERTISLNDIENESPIRPLRMRIIPAEYYMKGTLFERPDTSVLRIEIFYALTGASVATTNITLTSSEIAARAKTLRAPQRNKKFYAKQKAFLTQTPAPIRESLVYLNEILPILKRATPREYYFVLATHPAAYGRLTTAAKAAIDADMQILQERFPNIIAQLERLHAMIEDVSPYDKTIRARITEAAKETNKGAYTKSKAAQAE